MNKIYVVLIFCFLIQNAFCQDIENLTKDLKCFDRAAYSELDLLVSSRSAGEYEVLGEWSQNVSSDDIITKRFPMEGDYQYVLILSTEDGVDGTGIEIKNKRGERVEYEYKVNEMDNSLINFFFTPPLDDLYSISFRTVNSKKSSTCMFMAILKGEEE